MIPRGSRWSLILVLLALPAMALAYGVRVHALLPSRSLGALPASTGVTVSQEILPGITDRDVADFRGWLYDRAAHLADTSVRHAFLARYPSAASFDARALKEFTMMNGAARVLGVDSFASVYRAMNSRDRAKDPNPDYSTGSPMALKTALQMGSIYPDLDRRNQNRLLRGPTGAVERTAKGDTVPFDPMTLNMGKLTGLSSQGHAHGGLNRHAKSSDPEVLKTEPWNFAIATGFPGPVETYGPDNAQLYSDLSLLAALGGQAPWRTLSAFYAGNAMHYLADVGNAVHTVQVGIYPIFVDATIQSYILKAVHLFGLLGTAPTRNQIGVDIITNLHTLSEQLFEAELIDALNKQDAGNVAAVRASMRKALDGLAHGDDSLARAIADTLSRMNAAKPGATDFGRAIAEEVIDANVRDGAEVYRITRDICDTRLRIGRMAVDFDTIPDEKVWRWVRVRPGALIHTKLDDFNEVHARGIARTSAALRAWWGQYLAAAATPAAQRSATIDRVLTRLVHERLSYLSAAEARRSEWITQHR
ncbi:MAG TPA: hypothetical protein VGI92_10555 [Gemmatimonadales bacterium]|jgi:hypothetical protein